MTYFKLIWTPFLQNRIELTLRENRQHTTGV